MRRWILKAKLPLEGDSGVSVCACMFAKEQGGRLEHGGDCGDFGFCTVEKSFFHDAYHVEAEPPLWTDEILFPRGLQLIMKSV